MPPKLLKLDLQSKPQSTPEDQFLMLNLFSEKIDPSVVNLTIYKTALSNIMLEALSSDKQTSTSNIIIPESPSQNGQSRQVSDFNSILSPRSVMSPFFQQSPRCFQQQQPDQTQILSRVAPVRELKTVEIPVKASDPDEIDIINSVCDSYSQGITIHTLGLHPAFTKSQNLSKRLGRTQFDAEEELRIVNDVIFEGVFGLPGFLAWTALPLALAYFGKEFSVETIAEQLLTHGEIVQQIFTQQNSKKFLLTPLMLKKWYNEFFEQKTIHERLFNVIKQPNSDRITIDDLQRICQVLLRLHPGLSFLQDTPQFQSLYSQTISYRILFESDTNFKGYLNSHDLKKIHSSTGTEYSPDSTHFHQKVGGLLDSLWQSQFEQDINKNLKCFSYEHFYVFYVSFWELDLDHDKQLTLFDLERYAQNSLSKLAIRRTFDALLALRTRQPQLYECVYMEKNNEQKPTPDQLKSFLDSNSQYLFYPDFIRFLIFLENPDLDVSVHFWFEICDLDCDGCINFSDFKTFFNLQRDRMEANGSDILETGDVWCQLIDFYKRSKTDQVIRRIDILKSQARGNIFSVMLHYQRLQQFDQKDPYTIRNFLALEKTLWEKFCRRQYDQQVQGAQGEGF
ncbi:Phosphoprotein phosphatase 2A regulatory subunit [Spironucleus salmonicida]|uniref:Phosphoprotein phosphatase 2A regulatory subunit n=1 Tax=Spironucleus salmonicida TaxID=348837 RepID=V6LM32_9EUKA|nr:Phosphoprotein phosphatase 2A regulatory subunit [Spironucleus salmonicida]|eukprot:EST45705.1 Phosphoprotein phosphatase 2A regulatory subunit [Spironucleus salmonicida]